MSDHQAQKYIATGPADVGFRTHKTGIEIGVDATGRTTGVRGSGRTHGVVGTGNQIAGVLGEVPSTAGRGVIGLGRRQATGVLRVSTAEPTSVRDRAFAANIGVEGISDGGQGIGIWGRSVSTVDTGGAMGSDKPSGSGTGVLGTSGSGTGVKGEGEGAGVQGVSGAGPGVQGSSSRHYGGVFESGFAPLRLQPSESTVGPPRGAGHRAGELFVDAQGALYYCSGGTPARWVRVAAPVGFLEAARRTIISFLAGLGR